MKRNDFSLLALRLILGIVVLGHGSQKLFGWFGGFGLEGTLNFFTQQIGLPYPLAILIVAAESLGMVLLILGIAGRYAAALLIPIMIGAIITVHSGHGFFMNWFGNQAGEGYEYHLLIIGMSLSIAISGTGAYSLDQLLFRPKGKVLAGSNPVQQ